MGEIAGEDKVLTDMVPLSFLKVDTSSQCLNVAQEFNLHCDLLLVPIYSLNFAPFLEIVPNLAHDGVRLCQYKPSFPML